MEEINIDFNETLDNSNKIDLKINNDDELNLDDNNVTNKIISSEGNSSQPSVNFGGGLELLMNDKRKDSIGKSNSKSNLEDELNDLEGDLSTSNNDNEGIFKKSNTTIENNSFEDLNEEKDNTENVGVSTIKISNNDKVTSTWDGYKKIDKVVNNEDFDNGPTMSKEELLKEKFNILRKLETLERKGVQLTKKYSMESNLMEMKGEYENIIAEKEKKNSIKFQGKVLSALITSIEFLNNKFDPFDIKLDGWSEQINENLEDYDEIFSELHDKYKSKASMSPELKLIFQLAASGMMLHMTNTMFKSAIPGMDDIMRQNPDLMQHFTQAAMSSMNQSNPGTANFMNSFSNQNQPPRKQHPQAGNSFMRENPNDILPPQRQPPRQNVSHPSNNQQFREEMKGPSKSNDINDLLSGLKKKNSVEEELNNDSIISLEDMNNLNRPKRGRKKKNSPIEKNTISLDI